MEQANLIRDVGLREALQIIVAVLVIFGMAIAIIMVQK
jgi:hypothetical protein